MRSVRSGSGFASGGPTLLAGSASPSASERPATGRRVVDAASGRASDAASGRASDAAPGRASDLSRLARPVAPQSAAGPLGVLLREPGVTDVLVNGAQVWVDRGAGLQPAPICLGGPDEVRRLAQALAAACGRRLDEGCPFVDARLPDGTRVHAALPPVARGGPYLSLRTLRGNELTLTDLVAAGCLNEQAAGILSALIAGRLACVVSGGTGSGKTTLLAVLLALVPPHERIVLVEDSAELCVRHPHVVSLEARTPNVEGAGAITLRDLVRQALRMRPDRIVVGECRGAEVVDLLAALNTGHEGGAVTLHANSPQDVLTRLEGLGLLGGLSRDVLSAQVAAGLQVVLHMRRTASGRLLDSIHLLVPAADPSRLRAVRAWCRAGGTGPAAGELGRMLAGRGVDPPAALRAPAAASVSGSTPPSRGCEPSARGAA